VVPPCAKKTRVRAPAAITYKEIYLGAGGTNGHADCLARCRLLGTRQKTYARIEPFRFGPGKDIKGA